MTLSYAFKTRLFWIVARTNNCQYCMGHQEQKLSAVGMTDDEIAALDSDWESYPPAERAAFAYARKLTYEPHLLSDADIQALGKFYTPLQILEMTLSVAGNNAINRWKEGTGVPQSKTGEMFFARAVNLPAGRPVPDKSFLTPTSEKYAGAVSKVAALQFDESGKPTGLAVSSRPPLESREQVEEFLAAARARKPRLPLTSEAEARSALGENAPDGPLPNWVLLMANFPNESRGRLRSLRAIDDPSGDLSPLLKAQVSWVIARQDRAWYATGVSRNRLRELGQSDERIYALDGDWKEFTPAERALFRFARHLAASPIALTDEDVAEALEQAGPREVVQLINFVTGRAYFDRVTEAAGLPPEP
jgi:AhpD family alkylhydroperoxidase